LSKHRLIAREMRSGYRAKPLPDNTMPPDLAAAFIAWRLPIRAFTKPSEHTCQARTRAGCV
jgi:hypothetical protein